MQAEGGFIDQVTQYYEAMIMADEEIIADAGFADKLSELKITTDTGEEMTLEEIRALAEEGTFEWDKPKIVWNVSLVLQHFQGSGVRLMFSINVGFHINFSSSSTFLGRQGDDPKKSKLKCNLSFQVEQEVALGIDVSCSVKYYSITGGGITWLKVPEGFILFFSFYAGTFTIVGITVSAETKKVREKQTIAEVFGKIYDKAQLNPDQADREDLLEQTMKIGGACESLEKLCKFVNGLHGETGEVSENAIEAYKEQDSLGGGYNSFEAKNYYSRYSSMLANKSEYVPLFTKTFRDHNTPLISFWGIISISLAITFKIQIKVNVVAGVTLSYQNVKQYGFTINASISGGYKCKSNDTEMLPPEFRFDAFAFGMLGFKVSLEFDFRIGALSTRLASAGFVAEVGFKAELYGFLYFSIVFKGSEDCQKE